MGEGLIVRRGAKEPEPLVIEAGLIVEYFGLDTEIPFGWALCDGTGGRPDLQNLFIVGAGDTYTVESTGGSANAVLLEHTHTCTFDSVGSHNHSMIFTSNGSLNNILSRITRWVNAGSPSTNAGGAHAHTLSVGTTGESLTDKNLPPYYGLFYIIKLEEN